MASVLLRKMCLVAFVNLHLSCMCSLQYKYMKSDPSDPDPYVGINLSFLDVDMRSTHIQHAALTNHRLLVTAAGGGSPR